MKLQRDAFDRAPEEAMPTLYGGCWESIESAVTVIEFVEVSVRVCLFVCVLKK